MKKENKIEEKTECQHEEIEYFYSGGSDRAGLPVCKKCGWMVFELKKPSPVLMKEKNKIDCGCVCHEITNRGLVHDSICCEEMHGSLTFEGIKKIRKDILKEVKNRIEKLFDDVFEPRLYGQEARNVAVKYESRILELLKEIE